MQEIINVRIDVRLIHGQVAAMWVNTLGINRIIVVDDTAARDTLLKQVLKMACPAGIKLSILPPKNAAHNLLDNKYNGDRIMMVSKGPQSFLELIQEGFMISEINVGNMGSGLNTKMIKKSVHCSPDDIKCFFKLNEMGVHFTAQMYPGEEYFDFIGELKRVQSK